MTLSLWNTIDRQYRKVARSRTRKNTGKGPLVNANIVQFFRDATSLEPTDYQERFLTDQNQFVVARWARQTGKSLTLAVLCLHTALSGPRQSHRDSRAKPQTRQTVDPADNLVPAKTPQVMDRRARAKDKTQLRQRVQHRGLSEQP